MASGNHRCEVINLLADERGLPSEKVRLSDRLLQDLGMDGDDAVDFFGSVQERFGTDLTLLHERWDKHFGPEGLSCWFGLIVVTAASIGGLAAGVGGLSTIWGLGTAVALVAACLWAIRRWGPSDKLVPITVEEVIAAVEAGAWPRRPQA